MAVLAIVCLTACNDDDSIFDGVDHYISSFELQKDGRLLKAIISDDSITIKAAETLSLEGASAAVVTSEHTTIEPALSTITNWNNEQTFTVTGFNGESKTYYYSVVRTRVVGSGDIVLTTQDELEAFAALEISELQGSLTIGSVTGSDSITSLEPLSGLKIITAGLVINPTFSGRNLNGMENLEQVGSIEIESVNKLQEVSFPSLRSIILGLTITKSKITSLEFPVLENVDNSITLKRNDSITQINFSSLKSIVKDFIIEGGGNAAKLTAISLPLLENIGGDMSLTSLPELESVSLPELEMASSIIIYSNDKLETIAMPKLQKSFKDLKIYSLNLLTELDVSSLSFIGGVFYLGNLPLIANVDMLGSLTTVGGKFTLNLPAVQSLEPLSSLTDVNELVLAAGFQSLTDELSSLTNVNRLTISGSEIEEGTIQRIDVSNISGLEYLRIERIYNSFVLKGPENFDGTLYLYYSNFEIEGFQEVKILTFYGFDSSNEVTDKEIGVKKVTEDFTLNISNMTGTLSFPNLEEVGGELNLDGRVRINMPKLKNVGVFYSKLAPAEGGTFDFPSLETIDGDCYICTKISWGYWDDINMPKLNTVTGKLTIGGYSSYYKNTTISNLDSFSALTTANAITIQYNIGLTNYSGLQNVLSSFSADQWKSIGNGYNPTYQDLLNGEWTQEE